jgi:hypothetical protein
MVDQHPFLFEALARVNNNTFPFQHLKATCDLWTIYHATNDSISKFHLRAFAPLYPFQHALWWDIWGPLCLNFIMFWPKDKHLVYILINFPCLSIISPNFLHNILNVTWTTPSFNCRHPLMCMHTSHRPMGIHLLCCAHGNECIGTHDVIHDTFVAIAQDSGFHVGQK